MANSIASSIGQPTCCPGEDVVHVLLAEYERVIIKSLITSFGLDALLNTASTIAGRPGLAMDQYGGDVDTILTARLVGSDPEMHYKNARNAQAYESRGEYNASKNHSQPNYRTIKHEMREAARSAGTGTVKDAYTGEMIAFSKSKNNPGGPAELDHVIAAKWMHDDRGRVLANLDTVTLADAPENYRFTNKSLNASMGAKDKLEYIKEHENDLSPEQKALITKAHKEAKASYDQKIEAKYYLSINFGKDLAKAAGKQSLKMAARQVCGLVFAEIWFAVKEEIDKVESGFNPAELAKAIGRGIERGFNNAKDNYKQMIAAAENGALAGALASVTNTLCNIFFATSKNVGKVIRESYASLVEAGKILLYNPDGYLAGEQLRAAAKVLAVGASVVTGSLVMELISKTPIATIPIVGETVQMFCGALVSGILSCTLLLYLDRSAWINKLVASMNEIQTADMALASLKQQAEVFERYAAELEKIDYKQLKEEIRLYSAAASDLADCGSPEQLGAELRKRFTELGIILPWEGSFDEFMSRDESRLVFA